MKRILPPVFPVIVNVNGTERFNQEIGEATEIYLQEQFQTDILVNGQQEGSFTQDSNSQYDVSVSATATASGGSLSENKSFRLNLNQTDIIYSGPPLDGTLSFSIDVTGGESFASDAQLVIQGDDINEDLELTNNSANPPNSFSTTRSVSGLTLVQVTCTASDFIDLDYDFTLDLPGAVESTSIDVNGVNQS